ncbi:vitamin B12-dependent ribonucleotide reductase [Saccharopolyspora griseoalba]|uniref:ribonucleoside-diphosphate reductase n=1 Tax=Saccharopolyspora griseoalba TaxID=1431848 RepID=A0ABW2LTT5_9PSEU
MSDLLVPATPTITRQHVPRVRRGYRCDVSIGGVSFEITINATGEQLVEVDLQHAKHGTFGHGMSSAVVVLLNEALRHGMPIEAFVQRFLHTTFEPAGITDDPEVPRASSVMDYLAHRIALDALPQERCQRLGVLVAAV